MAEIGNPPLELDALREGAPVVPENRGTQHPILRIEKSRAMHLAREADSGEAGESVGRVAADRRDGRLDAFDPVFGVLLAPERVRPRNRQAGRGLRDGALIGVDQQRLDRRSAQVETQKRLARARALDHMSPSSGAPVIATGSARSPRRAILNKSPGVVAGAWLEAAKFSEARQIRRR